MYEGGLERNGCVDSLSQTGLQMVKYSDYELARHQKQVAFVKTVQMSRGTTGRGPEKKGTIATAPNQLLEQFNGHSPEKQRHE